MPSISVVIPAYNAANFIEVALDSVISQSFKDFEIIVINDGSIDNTEEILQKYITAHPGVLIRTIKQENRGYSGARNSGIQAATGKYVCFLDADDEYYPENLGLKIKCFEEFDVDFVFSRCHVMTDPSKTNAIAHSFDKIYPELILERKGDLYLCDSHKIREVLATRGFYIHCNTMAYKIELIRELGMFDVNYALNEDWALFYKTFFRIKKFGFIDQDTAIYKEYMQYINKAEHRRTDIKKFYETERKRNLMLIKILNHEKFDRHIIRRAKSRMCARKFKYKGLVAYRSGFNFKALKFFFKAKGFDKTDPEINRLIVKSMIPGFLQNIGRRWIKNKRAKFQ